MNGLVGGPGGAEPPDTGEFSKICTIFLKKIATMLHFSLFFQRKFKNSALNFRAFGRKTQLVGEILRKF